MKIPPLPHVRHPDLPWRTSAVTECGQPVDPANTVTRAELRALVRQFGQQGTARQVCPVCAPLALRWPTWDDDPVGALSRELLAGRPDPALAGELRALAALVRAHRDEYEALLDVPDLDAERLRRRPR